jgi:hypothetical protein
MSHHLAHPTTAGVSKREAVYHHAPSRPASPVKARGSAAVSTAPTAQRTPVSKAPRENRSLFEDEYRDEVTGYMHDMDVSGGCLFFSPG